MEVVQPSVPSSFKKRIKTYVHGVVEPLEFMLCWECGLNARRTG